MSSTIVSQVPNMAQTETTKAMALVDVSALKAVDALDGTDDWSVPDSVRSNPFFVEVTTSLVAALLELERRMAENLHVHLITRKKLRAFGGRVVQTGEIGVWSRNGRPVVAVEPGNYWNFSLRHSWTGKFSLTAPLDLLGLTTVLVGQSEAAVVMNPSNKIFIVRNSGFAAYGAQGRFRVIDIVDTLNLGDAHAHYESQLSGSSQRKVVLGWKRDVKIDVNGSSVVVASFFLVPANNVLILQRGNDLLLLRAGQHVLTNANTTFRGFYSLGERQTSFKTASSYTVEGVPVVLHVNLRYRIADPILLTANYDDAFQALQNPAQTAVNAVVSRLSYQQFMRASKVSGDVPDHHVQPWLDAFRQDCLSDLRAQAAGYGIVVESFDVLDRELEGALGKDLERQSEQVLRNQVQATQIELQNHIATETQRGKLLVARVEAEQKQAIADAQYYISMKETEAKFFASVKAAEADAQASDLKTVQNAKNLVKASQAEAEGSELRTTQEVKNTIALAEAKRVQAVKAAEAEAQASEITTEQDAKNIVQVAGARRAEAVQAAEAAAEASEIQTRQEVKNTLALADAKKQEVEVVGMAYAGIPEGHAQRMQLSVFEVEKRKALPAKTVYFAGDISENNANVRSKELLGGFQTATGWSLAQAAEVSK